jgi:hypothetical protein
VLLRCHAPPFGTFNTSTASKSLFEMIFRTTSWRSGCRSILDIALQRTMSRPFLTVCGSLPIRSIAIFPTANGGLETADRNPNRIAVASI